MFSLLRTASKASRATVQKTLVARFGSHHGHNDHHALPAGVLVPADDIRNQPLDLSRLSEAPLNEYDSFCVSALKAQPELAKLTKGQFLVAMRDLAWLKRQTDFHMMTSLTVILGAFILYMNTASLERVKYSEDGVQPSNAEELDKLANSLLAQKSFLAYLSK